MSVTLRLRIYVGALVALVVLFVVGTILGPRRAQDLGPVFPGLDIAAVQTIGISSSGTEITMEKRDGDWVIDEGSRQYPARADRITSFLDEVGAGELVRHVTRNENLWSDFGVTDEAGTTVTLRSRTESGSEAVQTVVWGAAAAEPGLSYLRSGESPDVYSSDGQLQFYLGQPVTYWSYLRVLPEDLVVADVIALTSSIDTVLADDEALSFSYTLEREVSASPGADEWVLRSAEESGSTGTGEAPDSGASLDGESVQGLVREVVDLVGSDFSRDVRFDPLPVVGRVGISLSDGRGFTVEILESAESLVCRATGPVLPGDPFGGLVYELTTAKVRRLFPDIAGLRAE